MPRKKTTRRRTAGRRGGGRPRKLATVSLADLQAELDRRRGELQERRDELARELATIDQELGAYGAPVRRGPGRPRKSAVGRPPASAPRRRGRPKGSGRGRGRGQNTKSLVESLADVLKGRTMSVTEVADAVRRAGYQTTSANFRTIVNQALITNPDRFRKVARGQYTAK